MKINQCPTHGAYMADLEACPRCNDNGIHQREYLEYAYCNKHRFHYHALSACPKCEAIEIDLQPYADTAISYAAYVKQSPNKVSPEEYNRYLYLVGLQERGIIRNLEIQIRYELLPKVVVKKPNWYRGFTQAALTYSPDFRYVYNGVTVIEEYKGVSITKKGNLVPRIPTSARNKVKLWISKYSEYITSGTWFFCISGWYRQHKQYYVFDPNGNKIDYPLTNYVSEDAA